MTHGEDKCPNKAGIQGIYAKMQDADAVIVTTPVYALQVTALVKNFIERLSYIMHRPGYFGKWFMSISTQFIAGDKDVTKYLETIMHSWGFNVLPGLRLTMAKEISFLSVKRIGIGLVRGYGEGLEDVTEFNNGVGLGDDGILSTAEDLALFLPALLGGDLLSDAALQEMLDTVDDGEGGQYGLGIIATTLAGNAVYGHDGLSGGFRSEMFYAPDEEVGVIVLAIAAPVGPIGVLCIRRTLAEGWLTGLVSGLGAATADALYGMVAAAGLTAVTGLLLAGQDWLAVGGGCFCCGWTGARFEPRPPRRPQPSQRGGGCWRRMPRRWR